MRTMKDSGIPWIEEIPENWSVFNIRQLFSFGKGLPITKENLREKGVSVISYGQIHSKLNKGTSIIPDLIRYVDNSYLTSNPESLTKKGDFIFADTSEDVLGCGNCVYVDKDITLFAGYHTIILRNKAKESSKYLAYLFSTDAWRKQIRERVAGVKLFSVSQKILRETSIILPPFVEQERIVDCLDTECARIDAVMEQTRASIEEYKKLKQSVITQAVTKGIRPNRPMKDSGIDWIGQIPDDWGMPKMNSVCSVITDYVASGSFASLAENVEYLDEPDYAMLIRTADISEKGYAPKPVYISKHAYDFLKNSNLFGGELMLPNIGASVGDIYIVPKLYERMSLAPNAIMVKTRYVDRFYYYYFLGKPGRLSIEDIAQSTAQAKFNKTDFRQLRVPLPSKEEQLEIAAYLDEKTMKVDALIAKKEKFLAEMESYKKSLIFEYVTGKKEVV